MTFEAMWDQIFVINLKRRPDRLESFQQRLAECDWPWQQPIRIEAVDGQGLQVPAGFMQGPGAFGCWMSHRLALQTAIDAGAQSVLILEDDALFAQAFAQRAREFFDEVPDDAKYVFLGGNAGPAIEISTRVLRAVNIVGLFGYSAFGAGLGELLQFWSQALTEDCDIAAINVFRKGPTYIPSEWLIGHLGGWSDNIQQVRQTSWFPIKRETRTVCPKCLKAHLKQSLLCPCEKPGGKNHIGPWPWPPAILQRALDRCAAARKQRPAKG